MSKALDSMDRAIDNTARALASLGHHVGSKDAAPSKGFQILIRLIGEAKTKHVSGAANTSRMCSFSRCMVCVYVFVGVVI